MMHPGSQFTGGGPPATSRDARALWRGGVVLATAGLLFGLASGARLPNLWSMTQWLFDYHFGVVKRGLWGSLLGLWSDSYSYQALAMIAFAVFGLAVLLLFYATRRAARGFPMAWYVLASYFVSQGFIYFAHTVGYFDHFGLIFCLLCLLLGTNLAAMILRLAICTVMLLMHEGLLVFVVPVIVFDVMLKSALAPEGRREAVAWLTALCLLSLGFAYWLGSSAHGPELRSEVLAYLDARAAGFTPREISAEVLFRDGGDNFGRLQELAQIPGVTDQLYRSLLLCLPYTIALAVVAGWAIVRSGAPLRGFLAIVAAAAALAPATVMLLAWDFARFSAQTQTAAFLVVLSVFLALRQRLPSAMPVWLIVLLLMTTVYTAAGSSTLMDGYEVDRPPFGGALRFIGNVATGRPIWLGIPEY